MFIIYFLLSAIEWVGPKEGERNIKIKFDETRKKIHVTDRGRKPLRMIDLRHAEGERVFIRLSSDKMRSLLSVRAPGEIDMVREQNFENLMIYYVHNKYKDIIQQSIHKIE